MEVASASALQRYRFRGAVQECVRCGAVCLVPEDRHQKCFKSPEQMDNDLVALQGGARSRRRFPTTAALVLGGFGIFAIGFGVGLGSGSSVFSSSSSSSSSPPSKALDASVGNDVSTRFFAIGDWGRAGNGYPTDNEFHDPGFDFNQTALASTMRNVAYQLPIDFVINTGDNFYEVGLNNATDPQFTNSFSNVYTGDSLYVSFYGVLGNHDYYGNSTVQITNESEAGNYLFNRDDRWSIRKRSWDIRVDDDLHLFFMDTEPWISDARKEYANYAFNEADGPSCDGFEDTCPFPEHGAYFKDFDALTRLDSTDPSVLNATALKPDALNVNGTNAAWETWEDQQVNYLANAMSASNATFKIVTGHHGILTNSEGHGDSPNLKVREAPNKLSIKDIVERYGDVWFNGHDHNLQLVESSSLNDRNRTTKYVTTGAGSSVRNDIRIDGTEECAQGNDDQCHELHFGYGFQGVVMGELIKGAANECLLMRVRPYQMMSPTKNTPRVPVKPVYSCGYVQMPELRLNFLDIFGRTLFTQTIQAGRVSETNGGNKLEKSLKQSDSEACKSLAKEPADVYY